MADLSESYDVLLNKLADEFATRHRAGERPHLQEYCDRHPELAEDIRALFPAMVELERAKVDAGAELAVLERPDPSVERLGDFHLLREVGRGGMGVVYEAEQISLGRRVAIKLLPASVFREPTKRRRFEREARAAAKLHHTNIVPVHGFGEHEGTPYYVMQFIPGLGLDLVIDELCQQPANGPTPAPTKSLTGEKLEMSAVLAHSLLSGDEPGKPIRNGAGYDATTRAQADVPESPTLSRADRKSSLSLSASGFHLPGQSGADAGNTPGKKSTYWESVARIGTQVSGALAYAHKLGVLHRDIKPANLLLDLDGIVWVTDFGLAKADDSDNLTQTGDLLGTLRYMPPEAFEGKSDERSDIYSLGLTLFELVALRPAYEEGDRNKLVKQLSTGEPPRLRKLRKDAPRDLVTIVEMAIDRDPGRRYQTAGALADDLQRFLDGRPITARRATELERVWMWARRRPAMAGMIAALLLCLLVGAISSTIFAIRADGFAREAQAREREAKLARAAAEAETYRAILSEVKSLRSAHQTGWRAKALSDLARLAVLPAPCRDLTELRTEAAATLGTPDIHPVATIALPSLGLGAFDFSPDGRTLVSADASTGVDFWNLPEKSHLFSEPGISVNQSVFQTVLHLPAGQGLAVATRDDGVVFTDLRGQRTDRAPITRGTSQPIRLTVSADGRRIAVTWTGGAEVTVHDTASGALLETFPGKARCALSPDGKWLACQENSEIVLLPIAAKEARIVLGRHAGATAITFSPNGALLAVAFLDHTTVIWDVAKREQVSALRGHRERMLDVAFSPDGEWIATGAFDYTARIWETRSGQPVATLTGFASPAYRLQWSPDGNHLAVGMNNTREIHLFAVTGRLHVQQSLVGHTKELLCVTAHPRQPRLITSGYEELISWDLAAPRPAPTPFGPNPGAVNALAGSPDGSTLAIASWSGNEPRRIVLRDAATGKERSRFTGPQNFSALAFDPTGRRLASGDIAGTVVLRDLVDGNPVLQFATGAPVRSIVFPDDPRLLTHGKNHLLLYNLETNTLERKVDLAGGDIRKLAMDRTRNRILIGYQSGAIGSLSLADFAPGPMLDNAHIGEVRCLVLSPDGSLLVSGGADGKVMLRDPVSFEPLLCLPVLAGSLNDLSFDAEGRRLAIVGTRSDVDLWDLAALRDDLSALGLAWDRPAPSTDSAPEPAPGNGNHRPVVPVIRRPGGR